MVSDSFDNLSKIVREHKLHVVEDKKNELNLGLFTFYKELNSHQKDSISVGDIYLKLVGRIIYSPRTNYLGINWVGNPLEVVIMGINGYLKEEYNKKPKNFLLNKKWELEEYKIITS